MQFVSFFRKTNICLQGLILIKCYSPFHARPSAKSSSAEAHINLVRSESRDLDDLNHTETSAPQKLDTVSKQQ